MSNLIKSCLQVFYTEEQVRKQHLELCENVYILRKVATAVESAYSDPDKEIISHYKGEVVAALVLGGGGG